MEQKFIAAWENNRAAANLMGVRMRPLDLKGAKRVLSGTRLSDGFNDLKAKGQLKLTLRPLTPRHDLRSIRGTFAQLSDKAFYAGSATDDYLHVILTDEEDVPEAVGRLRLIYPNMMKLSYDNTRTRANQIIDGALDVQRKTPLELFDELYRLQNNQPMSQEQRTFTQALIESIWEDNL